MGESIEHVTLGRTAGQWRTRDRGSAAEKSRRRAANQPTNRPTIAPATGEPATCSGKSPASRCTLFGMCHHLIVAEWSRCTRYEEFIYLSHAGFTCWMLVLWTTDSRSLSECDTSVCFRLTNHQHKYSKFFIKRVNFLWFLIVLPILVLPWTSQSAII